MALVATGVAVMVRVGGGVVAGCAEPAPVRAVALALVGSVPWVGRGHTCRTASSASRRPVPPNAPSPVGVAASITGSATTRGGGG